jgi:hypothetical protein
MSNNSNNANNNSNDPLAKEYNKLTKEIQETIVKQDELYTKMKGDTDAFIQEKKEFKLNRKIDNLKNHRNEVWNYLKDKYNENTRLRKFYFDKMDENKKTLQQQESEIKYLQDKLKEKKTESTTLQKNVNWEKYKTDRYNYYFFLYKIICVVLLLNLLLLVCNYYDMLGKQAAIYGVAVLTLCLLSYVVYYVYLNNLNRSNQDWDKIDVEPPEDADGGNCVPYVSEEEKEIEKIKRLADSKLDKINRDLCKKHKESQKQTTKNEN